MRISRRGKIAFFRSLGILLVAASAAVGFDWIILNWQADVKVVLGVLFFGAIVTGIILNTSFLVREIRRNEQHDSFINAVTHELKTPIASMRLYLQTLERRDVGESQRREFYRLMLDDTDRLLGTVEQVLKAGQAGHKKQRGRVTVDFGQLVRECVDVARASHQLDQEALRLEQLPEAEPTVLADSEELRTAVSNVLDNAVKYSNGRVDVSVRVEAPDEKHVTLRVKDQGVGIAPHDLKRVFKRFYRVPNRVLSNVK